MCNNYILKGFFFYQVFFKKIHLLLLEVLLVFEIGKMETCDPLFIGLHLYYLSEGFWRVCFREIMESI